MIIQHSREDNTRYMGPGLDASISTSRMRVKLDCVDNGGTRKSAAFDDKRVQTVYSTSVKSCIMALHLP